MTKTLLQMFLFALCTVCWTSKSLFAQNAPSKVIRGVVAEGDGNVLPGVSVSVANSSKGATTGKAGEYVIENITSSDTIVFSYVGFVTQRIPAAGKTRIDVVLIRENSGLNEVIVTGYSSQRKKDITGAISVVDTKALTSIPTGSTTDALQGQASGVTIISNGSPGSSSQIYVRGMTSFGNNNPLVLIDGIEGSLDFLNVNEVASIQVLKDAGSAAIFGVRGSNGVIIVTTRKGKAGISKISYDSYIGVQLPLSGNPFNLANSEEWWLLNKANPDPIYQSPMPDYLYRAPGGNAQWAMEGDPAVNPSNYIFDPSNYTNNYIIGKVNKAGTDWFGEVFKPAMRTNHTLSLTGGSNKSKFLLSVNYLNEKGTLIESYNERYSARMNSEFNIGKNLRIGENANIFYFSSPGQPFGNSSEFSTISNIISMPPFLPVYDISGSHYWGTFATPNIGNTPTNPVYMQKSYYNNRNDNWAITGSVYAELDFLKKFTLRTKFGGNFNTSYNIIFTPVDYTSATSYAGTNSLSESNRNDLYRIWTNTLSYNNTFGLHKIVALGGWEAIKYSGRSLNGSRKNFFLNDFSYLILNNGQSTILNSSNAYVNTLFSLFGRLDYSFNDKYLLGLTVRRDGSSNFGPDSRYGVFPSLSLGWRISDEKFMTDIAWLNDLKIRASYGVLGSQANVSGANAYTLFGSSNAASYYSIGGSSTGATPGFYPTRFGNSNTGWEKDIISNIGLDAVIFNNSVEVSAEIFKKSISGLLFPQPLPSTAGGALPPTINIGDVQNTGFELAANYKGIVKNNLKYTIGANISHYKNSVTSIPGATYFDVSPVFSSRIGTFVRNQVGHPIGSFYGYEIERLFQSDDDVASSPVQQDAAPGTFKYRDINGGKYEDGTPDGKINDNDRTFLGSPHPKFTYGINLGLTYKNFDFYSVFYGSYGNKVLNMVKAYTYFSYFTWGLNRNLLNQWSPSNTSSTIPVYKGGTGSFSEGSVMNSFYIEDGSFLKCRSMTLGYSFPSGKLRKTGIEKLRVYATGCQFISNHPLQWIRS